MIRAIPSNAFRVIRQELKQEYGKDDYKLKYTEFKDWYWKLAAEQPYIGDTKNFLWEQVYTAIAVFAFYETTGRTASSEKIGDICTEALIGNNRFCGKFINFNWKWVQSVMKYMYSLLAKQSDKHLADGSWNNTWKVELNPEGRTEGVSVRLIGCPVNDFARKHGYENLMPELCRSDYRVFEPFHCKMIRYSTVANGDDYCDFWQVGDKSEAWKNADMERLI